MDKYKAVVFIAVIVCVICLLFVRFPKSGKHFRIRDLDKDGIPNAIDEDIDGDGVPNLVEVQHGTNPFDPQQFLIEDMGGGGS